MLLPSFNLSLGEGVSGRLEIERNDGTMVREFGEAWVTNALAGPIFSPDDAYLAACLSVEGSIEWPNCSVSALDIASGVVAKVSPDGEVATWLPGDRLLTSGVGVSPVEWSHSSGSVPASIPADTTASVSSSGDFAIVWPDERTTVALRVGGVDRTVDVRRKTLGSAGVWSPDGAAVAFVVHGPEPSGGEEIVIVPAR